MHATAPLQHAKVVDLTHPIHPGMTLWPGSTDFTMTRLADYQEQGYRAHDFFMAEGTGTHLDAPTHFFATGRAVSDIPASELVAPAAVIDVRAQVARTPDYALTAADVLAWEAEHRPIASGTLVIAYTGWYTRFAEAGAYSNKDAGGVMRFPGFARDAAELLVSRGVAGIGIDTLSLDPGPSQDFAVHQVMLGAGKYQLENLTNLDALPATGALVIIGVLKVAQGTQAPARVLALLP